MAAAPTDALDRHTAFDGEPERPLDCRLTGPERELHGDEPRRDSTDVQAAGEAVERARVRASAQTRGDRNDTERGFSEPLDVDDAAAHLQVAPRREPVADDCTGS